MLRMTAMLLAGVMLLTVCGCAPRVSKENYDRINTGMSPADVKAIMGEPATVSTEAGSVLGFGGSVTLMTWKEGKSVLIVRFWNDRVLSKDLSEKK